MATSPGKVRDLASQIAAATCQWLLQVGELVVRGLWADDGAPRTTSSTPLTLPRTDG